MTGRLPFFLFLLFSLLLFLLFLFLLGHSLVLQLDSVSFFGFIFFGSFS